MRRYFLLALFLIFSSVCFADTIYLKNGKVIEGEIIERTDQFIKVNFYGVELTYFIDEIKNIESKATTSVSQDNNLEAKALKDIYLSYQQALKSGIKENIEKYIDKDRAQMWQATEEKDFQDMLKMFKAMRPEKVETGKAQITEGRAYLEIVGKGFAVDSEDAEYSLQDLLGESREKLELKGVVEFVKENGQWKIKEEKWDFSKIMEDALSGKTELQTLIETYKAKGHNSPEWDGLVINGFEQYQSFNFDGALKYFKQAYDLGCRDGLVLYRMAYCYMEKAQSDLTKCEDVIFYGEQAIPALKEKYPEHKYTQTIYNLLGECTYTDKAIDYYKKGLELNPADVGTRLNMAHKLIYLKRLNEAEEQINIALEEYPDKTSDYGYGIAYCGLGRIYYNKGEYKEAVYYFKKALEVTNRGEDAWWLALAYEKLGDYDNAAKNWKLAAELYGEDTVTGQKALGYLNNLQTRSLVGKADNQAVFTNKPEAIFETYKEALKKGDKDSYLESMTQESKQIVNASKHLMQREYDDLKNADYYVKVESYDTATVYFDPPSKKLPPYLLKKENGAWRVDLKRMRETYTFDQENNWHSQSEYRK